MQLSSCFQLQHDTSITRVTSENTTSGGISRCHEIAGGVEEKST